MKMKTNIRKWLSCILFAAAATLSVHAENGIIETRHYFICPGDTLSLDNGQSKIWSDSLFYDTIDEVHIRILLREIFHGRYHADETFTEILTTMPRYQHKFFL